MWRKMSLIAIIVLTAGCSSEEFGNDITLAKSQAVNGVVYPAGSSFKVKGGKILFPNGKVEFEILSNIAVPSAVPENLKPVSPKGITIVDEIESTNGKCEITYVFGGVLKTVEVSVSGKSPSRAVLSNVVQVDRNGRFITAVQLWENKTENFKRIVLIKNENKVVLSTFRSGAIELIKSTVSRNGYTATLSKNEDGTFLNVFSPSGKWLKGNKLPIKADAVFFLEDAVFASDGKEIYTLHNGKAVKVSDSSSKPVVYSTTRGKDFALFNLKKKIYMLKPDGSVEKTSYPSDMVSPSGNFALKISKRNRVYVVSTRNGRSRRLRSSIPLYLFYDDTALVVNQGKVQGLEIVDLNSLKDVYLFKALEMPSAYDEDGRWFAEAEEDGEVVKDIVVELAEGDGRVWFVNP